MKTAVMKPHYFTLSLLGLCGFYLVFELFFNHYAMLSVDEFWFAHRIYQYKDQLPYRDFAPYKTVLGYYLLLVPMLFTQGLFKTLIFTKNTLAILNTFILFGSSCWLTRFFSRFGVIASLAMLVLADVVLCYSTNIRVDLLGYWFCFFSLLFLLENQFLWAGILIGLGFITTQKSLWYLLASDCALAVYWLFTARNFRTIKDLIIFNSSCFCVIAIYIAIWSWVSDWHIVMQSVFYEASAMYQLDWYDGARKLFWSFTLLYNPALFLLWPLTFISLLVTYPEDNNAQRRLFVITYASVILFCLIPYKQVFPYYMQVTIPIFFVLYAAFFSWLFELYQIQSKPRIIAIGNKGLWVFLFSYISFVVGVQQFFNLPAVYLIVCWMAILLGWLCIYAENKTFIFQMIAVSLFFIAAIYPLSLLTLKINQMNGAYQKANVRALHTLVQDGSDYVAGIELIYNKTQPIAGMRHLMGPAVDYLAAPNEKLRSVMLASLYEDPNATANSVIAAIKNSNVKLFVNNYRMEALPANIKNYLDSEYQHYWGSIYLYAPLVAKGHQQMLIKFSGYYLLETKTTQTIKLNHHHYPANTIFYLPKGNYASEAPADYRLKLMPEAGFRVDNQFNEDQPYKVI